MNGSYLVSKLTTLLFSHSVSKLTISKLANSNYMQSWFMVIHPCECNWFALMQFLSFLDLIKIDDCWPCEGDRWKAPTFLEQISKSFRGLLETVAVQPLIHCRVIKWLVLMCVHWNEFQGYVTKLRRISREDRRIFVSPHVIIYQCRGSHLNSE